MFENLKKSIFGDLEEIIKKSREEENTEEKMGGNTQGAGDESIKLILILILIVLAIGVSIGGYYVWTSPQVQQRIMLQQMEQTIKETEKQYQACLEQCGRANLSMFKTCEAECKEKYGK